MRAVNLLPREDQRPGLDSARLPLLAGAAGTVLVGAVAAVLAVTASSTADRLRTELEAVEHGIASVPRPEQHQVTRGTILQEKRNRITALAAALTTRVAFDRVFQEISYVLPEDAWLTQVSAAAPVRPAPDAEGAPAQVPAGADDVTIQGSTYSHEDVARVLSRLAAAPSLANVRLVSSARIDLESGAKTSAAKRDGRVVVSFTIAASLRQEGSS